MSAGFTPGPWQWFGNAKNREIYLATAHNGRRYVMGFQRWGMRGAQPMFQPADRGLVPASDLITFEVGPRGVRGVEAAAAEEGVYRLDIAGIDCADARLIAAAPRMFDELRNALPRGVCLTNSNVPDNTIIPIECTMGDLRRIAALIAEIYGDVA